MILRASLLVALGLSLGSCGFFDELADLEPFPCAGDDTCPDGWICLGGECAAELTCAVDGECTGDRPRCGVVPSRSGSFCLPAAAGEEGEACSDYAPCVEPLVCEAVAGASGNRCQRSCEDGCLAGQLCVGQACVDSCEPFGTACGAGLTCARGPDGVSRFCQPAGALELYASCQQDADCSGGLFCEAARCRPACDATHPCEGGLCLAGFCSCDPYANACGDGASCQREDGQFYCGSAGVVAAGGACTGDADCASGLVCDGSRCGPVPSCAESCRYHGDGSCDDGGPGAAFALCGIGTDCVDCGAR